MLATNAKGMCTASMRTPASKISRIAEGREEEEIGTNHIMRFVLRWWKYCKLVGYGLYNFVKILKAMSGTL